jgi:hypothetical protein
MNKLQTKLRFALKLSAILGFIPALYFSIMMFGFAQDGIDIPWWTPVLFSILVLTITSLPLVVLPVWARKSVDCSPPKITLVIVHALLTFPTGPWAPILSIVEIYYAAKLRNTKK